MSNFRFNLKRLNEFILKIAQTMIVDNKNYAFKFWILDIKVGCE